MIRPIFFLLIDSPIDRYLRFVQNCFTNFFLERITLIRELQNYRVCFFFHQACKHQAFVHMYCKTTSFVVVFWVVGCFWFRWWLQTLVVMWTKLSIMFLLLLIHVLWPCVVSVSHNCYSRQFFSLSFFTTYIK